MFWILKMAKYGKVLWTDADVRCPFYLSDDRTRRQIACEGLMDDMDTISRFKTTALQQKHMGTYCVKHYLRCPIYQNTYNAKYREDDE